jgi:hypothetical protein
MAFGTLTVSDLLQTTQQSVVEFGEDQAFGAIAVALEAHNRILADIEGDLVETSQDRQRRFGGPDAMTMEEVDEVGIVDAQKIAAGATVGFPLRRYQVAVQWTRDWLETHTPAELAAQYNAAEAADRRALYNAMRRALFTPTNYTFTDKFIDSVGLAVKALVNADSMVMPVGPNGETFNGATHTHYLGSATFTATALDSLIDTVTEHYANGNVRLYINRAQETALRVAANFPKFLAYLDARIIGANNANQARGTLDQRNAYDRAIGLYDLAEVHVKPWVPANYILCVMLGEDRPLVRRIRNAQRGAFRVVSDFEQYPLRAQTMEREFGVGVWNRTAAAVLQVNSGTYTAPVFS